MYFSQILFIKFVNEIKLFFDFFTANANNSD